MQNNGQTSQNHYLLYTNIFFHIIELIANAPSHSGIQKLQEGHCYISELTRIEIISVLGKYARGMSSQTQICNKIISETGSVCGKKFCVAAKKGWKKRVIADWRKLIKDIVTGNCPMFTVETIPVTHEVCEEARLFISHALRYHFGSLDAMIAATAIEYKKRTGIDLTIVTYDKKLLAAIKADGTIPYITPSSPMS